MPFCQKCEKTMTDINFFTYKNGEKTEICKKCLSMHIDNFNPETYLWILEKMDVPYLPSEWNSIRDKEFAKNPNLKSNSVLGKYLSKMKLKQFKNYGYADSEQLQKERNEKMEEDEIAAMEYQQSMKEKLENGEITAAQYKTLVPTVQQNKENIKNAISNIGNTQSFLQSDNPFADSSVFMDEDQLPDMEANLTQEDRVYLSVKWGRTYKPDEWVTLEKMYNDMTQSFDIQDADTIGTLILICKTNLKMNQAIDIGDVDRFSKII